jgi:hypothetical protein
LTPHAAVVILSWTVRVVELREILLEGVKLTGLPLQEELAAEIGGGLLSAEARVTGMPSLLRGEGARHKKGAKGPFLVPALLARTLTPASGWVASSALAPEARLVAARTPRVAHLQTLLAVLDLPKKLLKKESIQRLTRRLARSVPGATAFDEDFDPERARESVQAELAVIQAGDLEERSEGSDRLAKLSAHQQLFGVAL